MVPKFKDRRPVYQAGLRGDGALLRCRVRPGTHQRPDAAGARRPRDEQPRRGVVPLRERQGRASTTTRRSASTSRTGATSCTSISPQLARGDVGRRRELPDARRGAQSGSTRHQRRCLSGGRVQGRQREQGSRRRRQPRARQVLGDLGQGPTSAWCGSRRAARTSSTRTIRISSCKISSRVRSRPTARCSAVVWSPCPTCMQYRDQLEEINLLTGRIHALSGRAGGQGLLPGRRRRDRRRDAGRAANQDARRMLVPISNWAAFGGSKEVIIWLPIDMIATTITQLVALRKQVIEDIYQIMGCRDIMRGATDPNETLGAQQLKTQYGSTRITGQAAGAGAASAGSGRDHVWRSSPRISTTVTIIEMSQTQLPTEQMQQQAAQQITSSCSSCRAKRSRWRSNPNRCRSSPQQSAGGGSGADPTATPPPAPEQPPQAQAMQQLQSQGQDRCGSCRSCTSSRRSIRC